MYFQNANSLHENAISTATSFFRSRILALLKIIRTHRDRDVGDASHYSYVVARLNMRDTLSGLK
jgi:hypothetical protein